MKMKGFTLIELLIVVAIIGILAIVSIPMYTQYVQKGHRNSTQGDLLSIERLQENYRLNNFQYTKDLTDLGFSDPTIIGRYTVNAQACKEDGNDVYKDVDTSVTNEGLDLCYMIIATPIDTQAEDGVLIMDSRGRREFRNAQTSKIETW